MSIPLYIINMQGCEDRWHTTQTRLNSIGMEAKRFSATVGKQLSETELQTWYCPSKNKKYYHRDLTKGEIGCYVSHMRIWQKMVDENIAVCVILEDDLFIQPHLKNVIEATLELQHWDLIKLSDNRDFPFIDTATLQDGLTLGNYKKAPNGTQGYIISLAGAKKLLTRKPFYRPVDVDMQFHGEVGLQMVGIKPYPLAEDRNFESEIANANTGSHSNRSTLLRNLKHRIRLYIQRRDKTADLANITADESH
ncbi:glycosyltransferase family 25 protein [Pseudoalteromonas prydzensis]|uniref:glycosyltransferase family 25 protein n=1 Tax=Pseudoalteromonas prydzensis TaxID=182141 RepID=UPI0007E4E028|nr:glycosyltransferase family 25 protein [Pseudoalteromonas prydzensis]MBE0376465.1 glycosyl transferase, family 25 [Pseudoalteromonas prydzensis ACAM 620]